MVCGIPTDPRCQVASDHGVIRARHGVHDDRPIVLLMGGGMGPTRMDQVAAGLCASGRRMHVVAVSGNDRRAHRRLRRVRPAGDTSLTLRGWVNDVPALMQIASVLVTKPGGVTCAEAAVCGVPSGPFDPIPGPEEHNAARLARVRRGRAHAWGRRDGRGGAGTSRRRREACRGCRPRCASSRPRQRLPPSPAWSLAPGWRSRC